MKFSIIIPVYNVEKYLRECLDSAINQTFLGDYEVVCINDGSTDSSLEILYEYAEKSSKIKVFSQANSGLAHARNEGLKMSKGEYVIFLDSDDYISKDMLQVLSKRITNEDFIVFRGQRFVDGSAKMEEPDAIEPVENISGWQYYNKYALQKLNFAFVCVVIRCYRRAFLMENNVFFKKGYYHEDNHFVPRVCYFAKRVKVISDIFYYYRLRENSIMTTRSLRHFKDFVVLTNDLAEFFVSKKDIDKTVVYRSLTHHYQVILSLKNREYSRVLLPLLRWDLYRVVSRTKIRHRINYVAARISPKLYRFVNKI